MRARRTARLLAFAAVVAAACPAAASAHATLLRSDPAPGAVVDRAPAYVRIVFDDVIQLVGGEEVVRNATRASVLAGKARLGGGGKVIVLPLRRGLPDGDYTVRWHLLSDDGHFESGVFAFGVGAGRAPPTAVLSAGSGAPSGADVVSRWLMYAGLLVAAGAVAFWLVALRPAERLLRAEQLRAAESVARGRFAALVLGGGVLYLAGAARFAHDLGWDTRFGSAVRAGAIAAVVTVVAAAATAVDRRARPLAAAGAIGMAAVPSVGGHSLDAGVPWPNVLVDLLHIYAAATWIGALVGLVFVLPAAARAAQSPPAFAGEVVRRVSAAALLAVLVIGASGVVRAVYELRALDQLWTTGYGRAILVKSFLLVAVVALGWLNRRALGDLPRLLRRVRVELILLAGLVVAVAFLTQLRPGRDAPRATAAPPPPPSAPSQQSLEPPAPPPPGALVLAQEDGRYGVAFALEGRAARVIVLDPSGGGAVGVPVSVDGRAAGTCGRGCYATAVTHSAGTFAVEVAGARVSFDVPAHAPSATATLRRATRAFTSLRSVAYVERLASGPGQAILTHWRVEAPNRASYVIVGGPQAVIIGGTRWDRSGAVGRWTKTEISPLDLPQPVWGDETTNAHLLATTPTTFTLAWANPSIPAFFTATFDRRTLHPRTLRMTAAAHFMHHRYVEFNGPRTIRPPR